VRRVGERQSQGVNAARKNFDVVATRNKSNLVCKNISASSNVTSWETRSFLPLFLRSSRRLRRRVDRDRDVNGFGKKEAWSNHRRFLYNAHRKSARVKALFGKRQQKLRQ